MDVAAAARDARQGDREAFAQRLEPVLPVAYRLAAAMLRSEVEAEDAVQDAVLAAWRAFARFRPEADLRPWFLTIVANRCRSYRRSRWWSVIRGETRRPAPAETTDAAVLDLRRALYRLPPGQRLLLVLRYYLDLPYDEVAAVLGITPKAARSRTERALARLRLLPEVVDERA